MEDFAEKSNRWYAPCHMGHVHSAASYKDPNLMLPLIQETRKHPVLDPIFLKNLERIKKYFALYKKVML